jgi:hypothetical protein
MVVDNSKFELCHSYPTKLLFPCKARVSTIEASGKYRSSNRLPGFTYYDKETGTSIWRCSQPKPGFFGGRNKEDEELLRQIGQMSASGRCAIYDARAQIAAMGNRFKGGGYEDASHYTNCSL